MFTALPARYHSILPLRLHASRRLIGHTFSSTTKAGLSVSLPAPIPSPFLHSDGAYDGIIHILALFISCLELFLDRPQNRSFSPLSPSCKDFHEAHDANSRRCL